MIDASRDEWLAWRTVCMLLQRRGINVDDAEHEALVRAMRHHAEAYRVLFEGTGDRQPHAGVDALRTRARYRELAATEADTFACSDCGKQTEPGRLVCLACSTHA